MASCVDLHHDDSPYRDTADPESVIFEYRVEDKRSSPSLLFIARVSEFDAVDRDDWMTLAIVGLVALLVFGAIIFYVISVQKTCPVC